MANMLLSKVSKQKGFIFAPYLTSASALPGETRKLYLFIKRCMLLVRDTKLWNKFALSHGGDWKCM